nr:MAG TPA: hypothetical protein [Caudoviricetes sp.]
MEGYAIKVTFSDGQEYFYERVTMRKGKKILVLKNVDDNDRKVYPSKRDVLNNLRRLRIEFGNMGTFEVIYSFGREFQKLR